jgi:uncharacterized protein YgiB involved in biofilm formation
MQRVLAVQTMKLPTCVLVGATAILLAGCGGAPPPKAGAEKAAVGVYTSAQDCSSSGKLDLAACNALVGSAVDAHTTSAKTYASLRVCETAEGTGRCERMGATMFRPELLAFVVTFSTPPTAQPLYAPKDKSVLGFITSDQRTTLMAIDEQLLFSDAARAVAEGKVGS